MMAEPVIRSAKPESGRTCGICLFSGGGHRFLPAYSSVDLIASGQDGDARRLEIVGTPYHNSAQTLVRHRTGDFLELNSHEDIRQIANGRRDFAGVQGRLGDVLYGPDGETLVGIDHIPRGLGEAGRFQFVQTGPSSVEIRVQGVSSKSGDIHATILNRARIKIPATVTIEIKMQDELERTASGKIPFVIHHWRPSQ